MTTVAERYREEWDGRMMTATEFCRAMQDAPTSPLVKRAYAYEMITRAKALLRGDPLSEIGSGVTTLLDAALGSLERAGAGSAGNKDK